MDCREQAIKELEQFILVDGDDYISLSTANTAIQAIRENASLRAQLAQVTKERDKAIDELRTIGRCDNTCRHGRWNKNDCSEHKNSIENLHDMNCFEWRGCADTEGKE